MAAVGAAAQAAKVTAPATAKTAEAVPAPVTAPAMAPATAQATRKDAKTKLPNYDVPTAYKGSAGHPLPHRSGLRVKTAGPLEFISNFECSNGELFTPHGHAMHMSRGTSRSMPRCHIVLRPDPSSGEESTQRKRWFYFGVRQKRGATAMPIRIVVNNMSDMTDLFNLDAHRPFYRHVPESPVWRRIEEPCRFVCRYETLPGATNDNADGSPNSKGSTQSPTSQPLRDDEAMLLHIAENEPRGQPPHRTCYIAWDLQLPRASDVGQDSVTYFAFSPPYGYTDLQEYLSRLDHFFAGVVAGDPLPEYVHTTASVRPAVVRDEKPATTEITVKHVTDNHTMRLTVRADVTMKQVRLAIATGLGNPNTRVKLLRRSGGVLTAHPDSERLNEKTSLLMIGPSFPDNFVCPQDENLRTSTSNVGVPSAMTASAAAQEWRPRAGANIYYHHARLCRTREKRNVDMLTITEDDAPTGTEEFVEAPPRRIGSCIGSDVATPVRYFGPGRRIVFVSARVHPGETPAQFAFFGLLHFLLGDDPRARLLRRFFVFKLVPMLNPDGVAHGHTRSNLGGLDLNRCYGLSPSSPDEHEAVFWVQEWLAHWAASDRLLFYLDMHAHAHARGCVLYGNGLAGASQVWNIAYAVLCQKNSPHFDMTGCEFPPNMERSSRHSGRAQIAELCSLCHSYTLECHYSISQTTRPLMPAPGLEGRPVHPGLVVNTLEPVLFGVHEWESVGVSVAVALLDLHCINPHAFDRALVQHGLLGFVNQVAASIGSSEVFGGLDESSIASESRDGPVSEIWRVKHSQVLVRGGPSVEHAIVDMFSMGSLLRVASRVDAPWLRLETPGGNVRGRLDLGQMPDPGGRDAGGGASLTGSPSEFEAAYVLADGAQKGLGILVEPTNMRALAVGSGSAVGAGSSSALRRVPSHASVASRDKRLAHLLAG
eukprot:NODE_410_length_3076_cov_8.576128.p1 GENE.NODE_410_length_3076_cov_8.576128~~NODE_410_length_3076_cov_8.576128.p1  ORF type:complete len:961 (+),score=262.44 NODE_410_length_3076_cov_8.576128:77-2884(+)